MGFMDGFTSDGTVDMKHTEYYNLMKEAAKAELLSNAVKAEVPGFYIQAMITGEKPEFLNELKAEEEDTGFHAEYEQITGAVASILEAWTEENGVESAAISLHRLIDTLEVNRIDELRAIKGNQEEYRKKLEAAFKEMENTMEVMGKMPPINVCLNFGSKKGQAAAGEPEEGKPQGRDCWSCRTCGNTKPVRMNVDKCRECEDGSQYTEADTPDEKSHEMESEEESERTQEKKKVFPYPKTLWRGNAYSYGGFSKVIRGGYNGGVYPGSNGNNANYFQGNADCK